jgi:hypothetical protein
MISLRLEMDYCAALQRQNLVFSADDARAERERAAAVREVQRLRGLREQMRGEGTLKREQHTMKGARP